MTVVIGSARISENGSVNGVAGDQKQTITPDFKGEVSLQNFYVHKKGWYVLRPKSALHANQIALNMYDLCNNKNAGYSQNDRYGVIRLGVHGSSPFNCDCSTGVRECAREATQIDPGDFTTASEVDTLMATGLFDLFSYVSDMDLYTGDILVTKTKGHTAIVVTGINRPVDGSDTGEIKPTHSNPYTEPTKILRKGAKGDDVKWVQYELTESGFDLSKHGGIDGDFGPFTESCVKAFQKTHHLEIDGEVGRYTRTALKMETGLAPVPIPESDKAREQHTFGIDVAKWQGVIDWVKVKAAGNEFSVLKVTKKDNSVEDSFPRNYIGCKNVGMPIAVYRYVYARNVGDAVKEANGIVVALSGKKIEGEVWLDMEDASIRDLGKPALTQVINAEASVLINAGYKVGVYCNRDWYEKVIDGAGLSSQYKFWIAKYGKNTGNGSWQNRSDDPKDIAYAWQYTSKGSVPGISGNVDLDLVY